LENATACHPERSEGSAFRNIFQQTLGDSKMAKTKRHRKILSAADFSGDGEPYSEVIVTISIRILGEGITRSRLAVNVCPDPALQPLARKSLQAMRKENFGVNEDGMFGACLSDSLNGWEDLNDDYPRIDERVKDRFQKECLQAMNDYIKESVDWALAMNKQGMEEAAHNDRKPRPGELVM
jgi:hypothetical protein